MKKPTNAELLRALKRADTLLSQWRMTSHRDRKPLRALIARAEAK